MESKDLIITFVWIFVLVLSVALFWVGESYVAGMGDRLLPQFFSSSLL